MAIDRSSSDSSEDWIRVSPRDALLVDEFQFNVTEPVPGDLAARTSRIFAMAQVEAQRLIDDLLAANDELGARLANNQAELAEVVAPVQLVVDDRSDAELARELAALVAGQVIEHAVSSASTEGR